MRRSIGYVLAGRLDLLRRLRRRRGRRPRDALRDVAQGRRRARRASELFEELQLDGPVAADAQEHVGRPEAPPRHRDGADPRPDAGLPRRADHRPRPAGAGQPLGATSTALRSSEGATVFLTTHYLDEADALADRIVIIDRGEIVASDTADNLKAQVSGDLVDLEVAATTRSTGAAEQARLDRRRTSRSTAATSAAGSRRAGRAVPGLLRDLDAAGVDAGLDRGASGRRSTTCSSPSPAARCATPRPARRPPTTTYRLPTRTSKESPDDDLLPRLAPSSSAARSG